MTLVDRGWGVLLGLAGIAGLTWAAQAPLPSHPAPDAMLRLAWSMRPERLETCREPSAEETRGLPPHMRQRVVCEGVAATYRLSVRAGRRVVVDRLLRAGGLRQDRRVFVFDEIMLPAGDTELDVRLDRVEPDPPAVPGAARRRPGTADTGPPGDAIPARLALARRLRLAPRRVLLVTYDAERRSLVAIAPADR